MKYSMPHLADRQHMSEYKRFLNSEAFTTAVATVAATALLLFFLLT